MSARSHSAGLSSPVLSALAAHAEALVERARILVLGDAESPFAEHLLSLGAASVHVYDPDPARARLMGRLAPLGVIVRALDDGLDVRDGMFDVAFVPDLAATALDASFLAELRRVVHEEGAVLAIARADMGTPSRSFREIGPASISYAELYDLFTGAFDAVSMTGLVPFEGIVFAELGESTEPAISVDTSLAPEASPDVFLVVASTSGVVLDPYAIVQVPALSSSVEGRAWDPTLAAEETRLLHDEVARLEGALARSSAELAENVDARNSELDALEEHLRGRAAHVATLERELARRDELVRELVAAVEEAKSSRAEAVGSPEGAPEAEIARLEAKLDALARQAAKREGELVARGWRIAELEAELHRANEASSPVRQGPDSADVANVLDERDALRQALTQEHEARCAAEQDAAKVRAELASSLIERALDPSS